MIVSDDDAPVTRGDVHDLKGEVRGLRRAFNKRTVVGLLVVVAIVGSVYRLETARNESRDDSRCRNLTAAVEDHVLTLTWARESFGDAAEIDALEAAYRKLDARRAENVPADCPATALFTRCADGSYSTSSGRGTCSHHGGVADD